jgi:hypothetical protein
MTTFCLCVYGILYSTKYVHIKSTTVYAPRWNWDSPPTPHPQASVPPPPCFWGEGNTRWRERGWESPNSDEGHTHTVVLFICTYFVLYSYLVHVMQDSVDVLRAENGILQRKLEVKICTNILILVAL